MPPLTSSLLSRSAAGPISARVTAASVAAISKPTADDWLDPAHNSDDGAHGVERNRCPRSMNNTTSSPSCATAYSVDKSPNSIDCMPCTWTYIADAYLDTLMGQLAQHRGLTEIPDFADFCKGLADDFDVPAHSEVHRQLVISPRKGVSLPGQPRRPRWRMLAGRSIWHEQSLFTPAGNYSRWIRFLLRKTKRRLLSSARTKDLSFLQTRFTKKKC